MFNTIIFQCQWAFGWKIEMKTNRKYNLKYLKWFKNPLIKSFVLSAMFPRAIFILFQICFKLSYHKSCHCCCSFLVISLSLFHMNRLNIWLKLLFDEFMIDLSFVNKPTAPFFNSFNC